MARGSRSGWYSPATAPVQQSGLCLRSREAELSFERWPQPRGRILLELTKAPGDILCRQPRDSTSLLEDVDLVWRSEAHGPGAVMTDGGGEERKWRRRRCAELACPSRKHSLVLRE